MRVLNTLVRFALFAVVAVAGIVAGWLLLVEFPTSTREFFGIVVLLLAAPVVIRVANSLAESVVPSYNVAEVSVEGPITRDRGSSPLGTGPMGTAADALVDQIERADAESSVDALLVRLNTPGGEIVPSEDIKLAVERFDGPTVAYATDTCASGGYEIASGCDEIWARAGSIVGSIGVIGSRVTAKGLADRLGLEYQQLTAGEYKDAGMPLKDLEEHEREYLQGLVDGYYDMFVENVAERREIDPETVRETEARVYLGHEAHDAGLVDELGTREDVLDHLEQRLGAEVTVEAFEPQLGLADRFQRGAQRVAFSLGAGITNTLVSEDRRFEFR
ncbi:MAG: signal peptide peptidase SppA [Halovenus sp.]